VARFDIKPGSEDDFVAAYDGVRGEVAQSPGCRSMRMTRGVESPSSFVLLIEWDSLEAHTEGFRGSSLFTTWRGAIGPYFAGVPVVEHVIDVTR
jgi:heme-degrading monooxygenase HmoA